MSIAVSVVPESTDREWLNPVAEKQCQEWRKAPALTPHLLPLATRPASGGVSSSSTTSSPTGRSGTTTTSALGGSGLLGIFLKTRKNKNPTNNKPKILNHNRFKTIKTLT